MAKQKRALARADDRYLAEHATTILPSARAAATGGFRWIAEQGRWPPGLTTIGITPAAVEAEAARLERETLAAVARVAVDDAMNQTPSGTQNPGGRPKRHVEIRAALASLPKVRRLKLLAVSKRALYAELRRVICEETGLSHGLGDKAMAAALKGLV